MSDPFIAEIKIFAGNFAPRGFAFCSGQLLPIAQNTALFSLIGTIYGGDGRTTMGLPNLRERVPMHPGQGPGLTRRRIGERAGVKTVTLSTQQTASHNHAPNGGAAVNAGAHVATPSASVSTAITPDDGYHDIYGDAQDLVPTGAEIGGGTAHANEQPYLTLNFIIALVGIYPSRN